MKQDVERKRGLLINILYVYRGVVTYKPYLLVLLFVSVISTVGTGFVWLYDHADVCPVLGGSGGVLYSSHVYAQEEFKVFPFGL